MLGSPPSSAATHDPGATAVNMSRPALLGRSVPVPWLVVLILLGGGTGSVTTMFASGSDGTNALARVAAAEAMLEKQAQGDSDHAKRIEALEEGAAEESRRARERARVQQWMVGVLLQNHTAITAIAKEMDLDVPEQVTPLLPAGMSWPPVVETAP